VILSKKSHDMLENLDKLSLLPYRSDNVKDIDNQQGGIMIEYSKEDLLKLYDEFGSVKKIAKEINVPKSTLNRCFEKYHIILNKRVKIKKDDLLRVLKELGSVYKVADRLGVQPQTVYNYIDKYGINMSKFKDRFPYSKEQLIELYNECGSITKVASKLSRNYATVRYWYKSLDIVFNQSGMTVFKELRNTPMTKTHESVLIGSVLGDGSMWLAPHSNNARLYVRHCEKQLGYLRWVHGLLAPFSRPIKLTEKAGDKKIGDCVVKNSNFYSFYTIAHPDITSIYKRYYKDNYKYVDDSIVDKIDLLAMSIWFGDEGSILRDKNGNPVSCSISTNSFLYKEQLILVDALRKFFDGTISLKKQGGKYKGIQRDDYVIYMRNKKEVNKFLDMIKLVLPECIHYKLS